MLGLLGMFGALLVGIIADSFTPNAHGDGPDDAHSDNADEDDEHTDAHHGSGSLLDEPEGPNEPADGGTPAISPRHGDTVILSADFVGQVETGSGDDSVTSNIVGTLGSTIIDTGDGADTVAGMGALVVKLGDGNDQFDGGSGGASVEGGNGNDLLNSSGTASTEEDGNPHVSFEQDHASDTLSGGEGNDTLVFSSEDVVYGGTGKDNFSLFVQNDVAEHSVEAHLTDFDPTQDDLYIEFYDPNSANWTAEQAQENTPTLRVMLSDEGDQTLVADHVYDPGTDSYSDGVGIAIMPSGSVIDPSSIPIQVRPNRI